MNQICNTCKIGRDEKNYLKDRTVCKSCYNRKRRKNQHLKIDKISNNNDNNSKVSTYEIHAYVVPGPRNVGKTSYMLKMLEKIGNQRPILFITRSPNQYPNYKSSNGIKPIKNTEDQLEFLMACWELESVIK